MAYSLEFAEDNFTVNTLEVDGQTITYRAYENIVYVQNPVDTLFQTMNIYVPQRYYDEGTMEGFTLDSAPIFLPITVGGYMPGAPERPGKDRFGNKNAAFVALSKGYVVAAPGARGRQLKGEAGNFTGMAPACIVDLKAAVRYLRHNSAIPGDKSKIISNGTSAGGALSSLLGATGDHADYEPYLEALGAADERDDIFAASCYCPITNLEHADIAYEWTYNGLLDFYTMKISRVDGELKFEPFSGTMTREQAKVSDEVKTYFPAYLNGLGLKSPDGEGLVLDADGEGSFKEYVKSFVAASAQKAVSEGRDLSDLAWLTIRDGRVEDLDFERYTAFATRMKPTLAFDDLDLGTGENELFGTAAVERQHFTAYSAAHSSQDGRLADPTVVKLLNPMGYIGNKENVTALHWRIRHGAADRDTSLAIPVILGTKLQNMGFNVDIALPWGEAHGGDYDLDELFAWMDAIVR